MADEEQWGKAEDWANTGSPADWTDAGPQDDWTVEPEPASKEKDNGGSKVTKGKDDLENVKVSEGQLNNESKLAGKREREKVEPYINPNRVETGGQQRTKLTPEELSERMEKIRLKNAQIKERREKIEQDKQAFSKLLELDDARAKKQAQVQAQVNFTRDENAQKKLERQSNRAWDQDKKVQKELRYVSRGRGGKRGRERGRDDEHSYANQEDLLAATLSNSTTTDEQWGKVDDWAASSTQDDWSKDPEDKADKTDLSAEDEWGQTNAETWA